MREILVACLHTRGYRVRHAATGREALRTFEEFRPDVTILDLGLPDLDGIDVCRRMRREMPTPIVVVTADHDEGRKVTALDEGADDYVTKPFSARELLARVRVALRHRAVLARLVDDTVLTLGGLVIDTAFYACYLDGHDLQLRRREFELVRVLALHLGQTVSSDVLLRRAWGESFVGNVATLRRHVLQLRRHLGDGPAVPRIENVPGVGYRMVLAVPDDPGDGGSAAMIAHLDRPSTRPTSP
jgi:DNA-binding response OmpR family regulator